MPTVTAIIVSAGQSTRMGQRMSKTLLPLCGQPVILHTLYAFDKAKSVDNILLVVREQDEGEMRRLINSCALSKPCVMVTGGETRQQSVQNGLQAIRGTVDYLAIHDGARPMIGPEEIDAVVAACDQRQAVTMAVPVKDTIKVADESRQVVSTPDRDTLWSIQTPQVFSADLYRRAMEKAQADQKEYTDDCQLVESMGQPVYLYPGQYRNIKITTMEDLRMAEVFLHGDLDAKAERDNTNTVREDVVTKSVGGDNPVRMGHGYDVHRLVEGRKLILGGVDIPHEKGLLGHSDADVLAHALSDALLGAAALGDIGTHFPDDDPAYAGADSLVLLSQVCQKLRDQGYTINNADATIIAQAPKLKPYIPAMRHKLAAACGLTVEQINVKATTEEGLSFTGRGEGIAAHAVCSIQ